MTDRERAFELLRKGHELDNENKAIIIDALGGMPKRTGHWTRLDYQKGTFECSECHTQGYVDTCMYKPTWDFCPRCGADMRGEQE